MEYVESPLVAEEKKYKSRRTLKRIVFFVLLVIAIPITFYALTMMAWGGYGNSESQRSLGYSEVEAYSAPEFNQVLDRTPYSTVTFRPHLGQLIVNGTLTQETMNNPQLLLDNMQVIADKELSALYHLEDPAGNHICAYPKTDSSKDSTRITASPEDLRNAFKAAETVDGTEQVVLNLRTGDYTETTFSCN